MPPPSPAAAPLRVVTGADEVFSRCLWQFLRSAERRRIPGRHPVVVFDLGLTVATRARLHGRFPWAEFRSFDFSRYPPHVALDRRTYAWKPLALVAVLAEGVGPVLWLDAATVLRSDLAAVETAVRRDGVYSLRGQAAAWERADPLTWQALRIPRETLHRPERIGGVIAFDPAHPAARAVAGEWARLALDPALIAPRDPPLPHHKDDQALLSLLLLRAAHAGALVLGDEEIDISSAAPVRWISSRNWVPPGVPGWADPLVRCWHGAYKAADRAILRLRRFKATRINGLHRRPKESFTVLVGSSAAPAPVRLVAPPGSYYADPFLWREGGRLWLLAEQFRYAENCGRIVALPLDAALRAGPPVAVDTGPGHASFPFLLECEGRLHLLPETCARRCVDLLVCEEFPSRWRLRRRLLLGVDAADPVLLRHTGRWWLFVSVRAADDLPRHLEIYHTGDLLAGEWQPHPVNALRLYASAPFGTGRNAGAPLALPDGTLLRPVQSSRRYYGEGLAFHRIVALGPEEFREEPWTGAPPLGAWAARHPLHHLAGLDGFVTGDVRTRVSYGQHWPRWCPWGLRPDPRALPAHSPSHGLRPAPFAP